MVHTVVVGGGIVGAATAWRLAARDESVVLFDRCDDGRATAAGAGISYAPSISPTDPASVALAARANHTYPALARALRDPLDQTDVGIDQRPMYKVALAGQDDALERAWEWLTDVITQRDEFRRSEIVRVDGTEINDVFPRLADAVGGVRFDNGLRIDGRAVTEALLGAARAAGAVVHEDDVKEIQRSDQRVTGVVTADRGLVDADRVVIAGGAWSGAFADDLGIDLPVRPDRGQIVHLDDAPPDTDRWPMVSTFSGTYLVPWSDGHVAVGATHEDAGFDARTTVGGVNDLLSRGMALMPGLEEATVDEARVGLRPASADGMPIIGAVPTVEGAYVVTGHGGGGLQRGPISGRLLADLITGEAPAIPVEPFSPARFG